jgi:hypothetical protein
MWFRRARLLIIVATGLVGPVTQAHGQEKDRIVNFVLEGLTVSTRTGSEGPRYIQHCRAAPGGCETRVVTMVRYIENASHLQGVDVHLLAAVAWKESRFHPGAISRAGAVGIFQINPRSPWADGLPFVRQHWYRTRCLREVGACQKRLVHRATYVLKRTIASCGGSLIRGLQKYNSGRCDGNPPYARSVLGILEEILSHTPQAR